MCLPVEPFKVEREWVHNGLSCAVTLAREGQHRCGYVRVPPGHRLHGAEYGSDAIGALEAHGGVNFAEVEPCVEHEDGQGWWFGFDCSHAWDMAWDPESDPDTLSPEARETYDLFKKHGLLNISYFGPGSTHYWTLLEVATEVERLADQLAELQVAA